MNSHQITQEYIKGNSLKFIRLLQEKTTRSNRMKFRQLPLMYSCVIWCEFIDLVGFLAVLFDSCHSLHSTGIH